MKPGLQTKRSDIKPPAATERRAISDKEKKNTVETRALGLDEIKRRFKASGYDLLAHPGHVIRRAHQRATMRFQAVMNEKDLTPTQMAALATIMQHGQLSQNQLGRLTAMDPSTISIVVRKLLKQGLVVRSNSASDQRLSIIRLTDRGVRYTTPRLSQNIEVGRMVLSPLTPDEQRRFMELLHKVAGTNGEPASED